jgi:hypothetical protein
MFIMGFVLRQILNDETTTVTFTSNSKIEVRI